MVEAGSVRELQDHELDYVDGGAFFIPLLVAGVKAGLAAAGSAGALKVGVSIGVAGASAALAAEIID